MKKGILFLVLCLCCRFVFAQATDKGSNELGVGSTLQVKRATVENNGGTYYDALIRKARAHASYFRNENRERHLEVTFLVKQSALGEVVSVEKIQESGDLEYDRAIWEGILRASPFPKRRDGTVDAEVRLKFIEN